MKRNTKRNTQRTTGGGRAGRTGFSVIELLVVIAIMSLLLALSSAAVMRVRVVQQVRRSSDVVEKLQVAVDNQYKAIIAQAQTDMRLKSTQDATQLINFFGGDTDTALAMLTYCRIRQSFPQTFAEVQLSQTANINGVNTPYFTVGGAFFPVKSQFLPLVNTSSANLTASQQSAALLYAAVSGTGAGGSTFASDEALAGATLDFSNQGSATVRVYKDAWNQPVGFCRFGQNAELQNPPWTNALSQGQNKSQDPLDPSGKLLFWAGGNTSAATTASSFIFLNNGDQANATSFNGANRRIVVYSCGQNMTYESLNITSAGSKFSNQDDILGYRLTQLGQKGTQ